MVINTGGLVVELSPAKYPCMESAQIRAGGSTVWYMVVAGVDTAFQQGLQQLPAPDAVLSQSPVSQSIRQLTCRRLCPDHSWPPAAVSHYHCLRPYPGAPAQIPSLLLTTLADC